MFVTPDKKTTFSVALALELPANALADLPGWTRHNGAALAAIHCDGRPASSS
jgi:hypothetical protein